MRHHPPGARCKLALTRLCRHCIYHEGNPPHHSSTICQTQPLLQLRLPGKPHTTKQLLSLFPTPFTPEPTPEPLRSETPPSQWNPSNSHYHQQPNGSDTPNATSKLDTSRLDTLAIPSPLITIPFPHPPHKLRHKPRHTTHHSSPCPLHQHQPLPHTPAQAAQ